MCATITLRRELGEVIIIEDTPDPDGACFATFDPSTATVDCWEVNCDGLCQLHVTVSPDGLEIT
jgi:hypothetical protein